MNPLIQQFCIRKLQSDPSKLNSPMGQELMRILQTGDTAAGEQMAYNICNSVGMTPQQLLTAVQQKMNNQNYPRR